FRKAFRDRLEVELALFEFTVAYERLAQELRHPEGERERLLEALRTRVLAGDRRPIDVDVLASERGMSRSAFGHFFRARTGTTPARFMTEIMIQEAARLLVTTPLPVGQIAAACGFADVAHFGKVFRRYRHQSPAVYRRSLGTSN